MVIERSLYLSELKMYDYMSKKYIDNIYDCFKNIQKK